MWVFIVNPAAGNGRGAATFERLQKTLAYQQMQVQYYYTDYEGHAEEIAHSLITNPDVTAVIVVGGDGTIHEVMNGLGHHKLPIGFIPGGSGNDFARGVGIKGSPEEILESLTHSEELSPYWLGTYKIDDKKERYFVNSMGIGFDAATAHKANHSSYKILFNKFRFGTGSYVLALLQVLTTFKPATFEITLDGEKRLVENCWLISVGNHPYYGGGMKIMPNAAIQPDKFSVLLVHSLPKWKVLALFLTVFAGKHEKIRGVELLEASYLTVTSNIPIHIQIDGQTTTCMKSEIKKGDDSVSVIPSK